MAPFPRPAYPDGDWGDDMASYKFLGALVIILSLPSGGWAKQAPKNRKGSRIAYPSGPETFNLAERSGKSEPLNFTFSLSGYQYHIAGDGRGHRVARKSKPELFNLSLTAVDHLVFVSYKAGK